MQTAPSPLESDIAAGIPSNTTNAPTKMSRGVCFRASKELGMDKAQAQSVPALRKAACAVVAPAGHVRCSTRQHE